MEELFGLSNVEAMLFQRAAEKQVPIYGGFELTPYCNLSCKMCYVHETKPGLSLLRAEKWLDFGRQAVEAGTLCIVLTGGEPLLHPDFKEIYLGLKKLGIVLTVNTNATCIDEKMADFFAEHMPRRLNISLYGADAETYQSLCGDGRAFEKTLRAIELLKERHVPVKINLAPNVISYPHLDEMLALCERYDLTVEMTAYLFEPLRKSDAKQQLYRLEPEQMAAATLKWHNYRYAPEYMQMRAKACKEGLETFEESRKAEGMTKLRCRAGSSAFWICWDGKMNACVNMIRPQADIEILGFKGAWELTKAEAESIRVPAKCSSCSLRQFCLTCAAVGFHQNGVFDKIPEIMCTSTECYAKMLAQTVK